MIRRWILLPAVLASLGALAAPPPRREPPPRIIAADPALGNEVVTTVYQDRTGFLWIGTRAGLILYDGSASTLFEVDVSDPDSLSDNAIRTVFEDSKGNLWVGTNAGGLDRLDRSTWRFTRYAHDASDPASISNDSVYAIVEDRDGHLWVGTQGGLNRLDPATGRFEPFPAGPSGPGHDYVAGLHLDRKGRLWIATVGGGLSRRDPGTGRFTVFRSAADDPSSIPSDAVFDIAEDDEGRLWLATMNGPCRMNPDANRFERFPFPPGATRGAGFATAVAVDRERGVWASSLDAGLWRFDSATGHFERHVFVSSIPGSPDRVLDLFPDRLGNIWVGTWGAGLGRVSPGARVIGTLPLAAIQGAWPDPDIAAVVEDRRGRLWLGNSKNGVWSTDPDGRTSTALQASGSPLSVAEDPGGDLWIGTTGGLARLDAGRGTLTAVPLASSDPPAGPAPGWIWALCFDRNAELWVGAGGGGLYRRRPDGSFERFLNDRADPNSLSDNYVTAVLVDRAGLLWAGTRTGGLNSYDPASGRWTRHEPRAGEDRFLSSSNVTALLESDDGTLWIGTAGGGLNRMDRDPVTQRALFTRFSRRDGLIDDNVVSLARDAGESIWIGTRRGLSRFDPKTRAFESYGLEDGLPSVDLHAGAAATGRSRMYFGTHRGVVVIPLGTPFRQPRPSPTVLTSIHTPSGAFDAAGPPWEASTVEVPYGQILSFEFATLDFGERKRHEFAYRLEPVNDDWIDLGNRPDITFTSLAPGTMTLRIRGRNDQGVWSETARPVTIRVIPPFWRTAWFRWLVGIGIVTLALTVHFLRTRRLERRNRELQTLKEDRERALVEARDSNAALGEAYQRLRTLTSRLEAAKEEERKWIARELHDEMGTGLTTAKLVLELLKNAPPSDDTEQKILEVIGLIDRMIGHMRALSFDLRPPLLDDLGLEAALQSYVETLSRRVGLGIRLDADGLPEDVPGDIGIAGFRIVQEGLTNVLRHAQARSAAIDVRYDAGWLDIHVRDDGKGFEVASTLERSASGGHAGLLGMRERVEAMGGALTIQAAPGQGTDLHARLPVRL